MRTKGQKRYGITNEVATHLFADNIVTAAPGFNAGTGRHIRAKQAYVWSLSLSPPPPPFPSGMRSLHAACYSRGGQARGREAKGGERERENKRESERASL